MGSDRTDGAPRPRVVILGGGFAGVGAARKLKDADVDVVVVDKHNYHTFQPLLYQVATDLLERTAVGHPLRDLFHDQPNAAVHEATVTAVDLEKKEVSFDEMEPLTYDYLVVALGAQVNFFGTPGAAEHAFPMYTLPDAVRLKDHVLDRWEAADGTRPHRRRRAERRRRGRRPDRCRDRRSDGRALSQRLLQGLPRDLTGARAPDPRRGRADAVRDVQAEPARLHGQGAREARRRGAGWRDRLLRRAHAGDAEVGEGAERAHARLGCGPSGQSDRGRARRRS